LFSLQLALRTVKLNLRQRANINLEMADMPSDIADSEPHRVAAGEMLLTEDDPRFSADKMVDCGECSRSNPPNRTMCIYCGAGLALEHLDPKITKINYQRPDVWEDGFSLIYSGKRDVPDTLIDKASLDLQIGPSDLGKILSLNAAVPLIYFRSLTDADLLASRLSDAGFHCAVVGDDLLQARTLPTRIRSARFDRDSVYLNDFNTGHEKLVHLDEKTQIIVGSLVKTSTEIAGKLKKRAIQIADETLSYTDEPVIDIYPESDVYGFRIRASGFDFSCLGDRMRPLAALNMAELVSEFRSRLNANNFIDSYRSAAPLIATIWPLDEIMQSSEVKRGTFGGVRKQSVTVLDNTRQFTKFSRLQRHFI
jgi:hypothetical protein